jgi:hypothetical protein
MRARQQTRRSPSGVARKRHFLSVAASGDMRANQRYALSNFQGRITGARSTSLGDFPLAASPGVEDPRRAADGGRERRCGEAASVPAVEDSAAVVGKAHAASVRRAAAKASDWGGESGRALTKQRHGGGIESGFLRADAADSAISVGRIAAPIAPLA